MWQIVFIKKSTVRQLQAGLLLLVFAFSITPKKFLHDALANHKDTINLSAVAHSFQISNTGFSCKCDNLVAESPFTDVDNYIEFSTTDYFTTYTETFSNRFYSSYHFFFELRGPPSGLWTI